VRLRAPLGLGRVPMLPTALRRGLHSYGACAAKTSGLCYTVPVKFQAVTDTCGAPATPKSELFCIHRREQASGTGVFPQP
jgi:hypothetical protein